MATEKEPSKDLAILGSGSLALQLSEEGMTHESQIEVNPVAAWHGRTMLDHVREVLSQKLTKARPFGNGNVLLCYEPMA